MDRIDELVIRYPQLAGRKDQVRSAADLIITCYRGGGTVFTVGNGGSAADSQHFAAEIVGRFPLERKGYPAIALTTDSNSRYAYLNPYNGGMIAVCEAARNVACVGAQPVAITNCLNFGNPYDPEVYWQFKEAIRGMGDACRALDTPVTGGNVSFHNESKNFAIFPTPTIGMLGIIDDGECVMSA